MTKRNLFHVFLSLQIKSNIFSWLVEEADLSWLMIFRMEFIPHMVTDFSLQRNYLTEGLIDSSISLNCKCLLTFESTLLLDGSDASTRCDLHNR